MNKCCFVTGATGFIASHLVDRLLQEEFKVRCLVRKNSNTDYLKQLNVELVYGELTDFESLRMGVQGCNYVFHCAAFVSDWGTISEIRQVNVTGTRNLLEAILELPACRFIYLSTTDVYGHPKQKNISEDLPYPTKFCNWYTQTKMEAELEVMHFYTRYQLPVTIIRPATVYGPRSINVIGEISDAIRSGQMLLINDGKANAGLCYISNLIQAIVLAAESDSAIGECFNVSDEYQVTWKQFIDDLADQLGEQKKYYNMPYGVANILGLLLENSYRVLRMTTGLKFSALLSRQAVQVMGREQDFNTDKIQSLLGYRPIVNYQLGLKETVKWIKRLN
jgi:nucleoside-diphosphate-sugar epimerase